MHYFKERLNEWIPQATSKGKWRQQGFLERVQGTLIEISKVLRLRSCPLACCHAVPKMPFE
jgi:hypothetical protein